MNVHVLKTRQRSDVGANVATFPRVFKIILANVVTLRENIATFPRVFKINLANVVTLKENVVTFPSVDKPMSRRSREVFFQHRDVEGQCRDVEDQRCDVPKSLKIGFLPKFSKLEKTPLMNFHTFPSP